MNPQERKLKEGLQPLPKRMQHLPIEERGYVVPWFVAWVGDKPEFRAMDSGKWNKAIREALCWVCGRPLGVYKCFVVGPMCGINRISSEPPSHLECAQWSAQNCPFLSNPDMVRREDEIVNSETLRTNSAGVALARNPGVTLLWISRSYEVVPTPSVGGSGPGKLLIMGEPERVEFWAKGRKATRQEIDEAVEGGLPSLVAMAQAQPGAMQQLEQYRQRFEKLLPAV